jgi:hypothetical protein
MRTRSFSVKQVTRAQLDAPVLPFSTLQSLALPCLNWCHEFLARAPKEEDTPTVFRSKPLQEAAHKVFPFSCHTPFSQSLVDEFDRFLRLRSQLNPPAHVTGEDVIRELRRPRSLLLTDWSSSLFDGALVPETRGFIDDDCMPPWDTWIALVHAPDSHGLASLLSWVPHWLAEEMDFAIQMDAASCLSWAVLQEDGILLVNGWGEGWKPA